MKAKIAFDTDKIGKISFQDEFPATTKCCRCGKEARLAFVAHEMDEKPIADGGKYVVQLYENEPAGTGFWPHDAICVAVYFCRTCFEATALWNQA